MFKLQTAKDKPTVATVAYAKWMADYDIVNVDTKGSVAVTSTNAYGDQSTTYEQVERASAFTLVITC